MIDGLRRRSMNVVNLDVSGTFTGGAPVKMNSQTDTWYVDKNKSSGVSGNGTTWEEAFITVAEAIGTSTVTGAAGDYDTVLIAQGVYDEASFPLVISQTGLKVFGAGTSGYNWGPCSLKSSASGGTIIEIDASGVEIAGLGFNLYTSAKSGIVVGASATVYKNHIHDCFFGCSAAGNAEGECGVAIGCDDEGAQGEFDAVDTHVERCGFHYLATAAIAVYGTRTKITECLIWSNSVGIDFTATGDNRAQNMAINNYLIGLANTGPGIKIASTEPTNGKLLIANNVITNFTTNITQDKSNEGIVNNGTQGDGSSPLIVDSQSA